ncbi:MAG: anti-sigma regulatory factor [Firmicutes bacterium]|nr:anti-sigma regulatory factor [Bacillota bacterium]
MSEAIKLNYTVDGDDFLAAGSASSDVKRVLRQLGFGSDIIRKVSIAMYEGEINMVIHADGGEVEVEILDDKIKVVLADRGPGIPDVEKAMSEGFSTAPEEIRGLGFGAGMGLPNMKKYTDEFDLKTEVGVGTTVTMTVYAN